MEAQSGRGSEIPSMYWTVRWIYPLWEGRRACELSSRSSFVLVLCCCNFGSFSFLCFMAALFFLMSVASAARWICGFGSKLFFGLVLHCNSASISCLRTLRIQVVTVTSPGGCNIQDIFSFSGFLAINLS